MAFKRWLLPAVITFVLATVGVAAAALTARADSRGHQGSKAQCSSKSVSDHWKREHCRKEHSKSDAEQETTTTTDSTTTSGSAQVCGLDVVWLKTSIEGDLFEIQGGQLALKKSQNQAVRDLAQRLITDHTKSLQDATELAKSLGIEVPSEPSPSEQWELEELGEMSGSVFNHDYSELEIKDHQQDIDETTDEIEMGCNPQVKDEAKTDLPMLQMHLQLSRQAYEAAGPEHGTSSSASSSSSSSDDND